MILIAERQGRQESGSHVQGRGDEAHHNTHGEGQEEVNIFTIQTLNDTTLIMMNDKSKTDELKRVKSK